MATYPPAPPTTPAILEPDPVVWPRVVGITSIALGTLPLCGLACSSIGPLMGLPNNAANYSGVAQVSPAWHVIGTVIGVANTILLITGGIMLMLRKPRARMMHLSRRVPWMIGGSCDRRGRVRCITTIPRACSPEHGAPIVLPRACAERCARGVELDVPNSQAGVHASVHGTISMSANRHDLSKSAGNGR